MNPETGEFVREDKYQEVYGEAIKQGELPPEIPESWPRFAEGETVECKGVEFIIQRINVSTIALRPVVNYAKGEMPRDKIREMTTRHGAR